MDCACCIKTIQCTCFQFTSILRTHILGMNAKFQKNTPKNKVSVHNTKLQVMQTRRTLTTSSTGMGQFHILHVLTVYSYRGTLHCVRYTSDGFTNFLNMSLNHRLCNDLLNCLHEPLSALKTFTLKMRFHLRKVCYGRS